MTQPSDAYFLLSCEEGSLPGMLFSGRKVGNFSRIELTIIRCHIERFRDLDLEFSSKFKRKKRIIILTNFRLVLGVNRFRELEYSIFSCNSSIESFSSGIISFSIISLQKLSFN